MCLLDLLLKFKNSIGIKVVAINVEHGIRGQESVNDSNFVEKYCKEAGVLCKLYSVDAITHVNQTGFSLEQSARLLRYDCFFDAIKNGFCDVVATAHHKSDNVETILFNLLRGSGLTGVSGISPTDYDGRIIRPLLKTDKKSIDDYVLSNNIPYVEDSTNTDQNYTRNFLRLAVLPKIKEVFPEVESAIERFSLCAKEDDLCLYNIAQKNVSFDGNTVKLTLTKEKSVFFRQVIIALKHLGITKDYQRRHAEDVYSLIDLNVSSKISLPKGIVATRDYDYITLYLDGEKDCATYPFSVDKFDFLHYTIEVNQANTPTTKQLKTEFFIDGDKLPQGTVLRTRRNGDVFTKFGGGTKKLNDYFTDKKIIERQRDFIPLLANGNDVLAVFGIAISDKVKIDEDTKTIYKLSTKTKEVYYEL